MKEDKNWKKIFKSCENLSIDNLDNLISELKSLRSEKFNISFRVIQVYNYDGNISKRIEDETKFHSYHKPPTQVYCGIGTNYIVIPMEQYTEELKKELLRKYDSWEN